MKTTMEKSKKKKKNPRPEEEQKKKEDDSTANVNGGTDGDAPIEKQSSTEEIQQPPNPLDNPFYLMEKALERKLRNLEKRQKRLEELKAEKEVGGFMPVQQQIEAMNKIDEIGNQIEFLGEMQKLNKKQLSQYKKCVKARDRELKKQQREELARSQTTTPLQTTEEQSQKSSPPQSEKEPKMVEVAEIEAKLKLVEDNKVPMPPESQPPMNTKGQMDDDENKENVPIAAATVVMNNTWGMGGGGGW